MQAHFDNAGWVEAHLKRKLTPFQARVAEIVGIIGSNAYNAPVKWEKVDWEYGGRAVSVVWGNGHMSTFDFMPLTTLVFLCHDARIRLEIGPAGPRGLRLNFWQRRDRGSISSRHPDLDEAFADHREWLPADHPLLYRNHPERQFERVAEDLKPPAQREREAAALASPAAPCLPDTTDSPPTQEGTPCQPS